MHAEVKTSDILLFKENHGKGSIVKVKNRGYYFMPAKFGMRIKGEKKPIAKFERFVFNGYVVQKFDKDRIIKCYLTRLEDGTNFAISETELYNYFCKSSRSFLNDSQ
tara:strand:- start:941 stop:1261 length:321 start_codon:yes stop_codon:yes gene_type:complete